MRSRGAGDEGFTLIELLLALTILGLIMGPLTGAILLVIGTTTSTEERLATSHDLQLATAYFGADVKNSGSQLVRFDSGSVRLVRRPLSASKPGCAKPTSTVDTVVVSLTWSDVSYDPNNPVATDPSKLRDRWAWYYLARPRLPDGSADLSRPAALRRGYCSVTAGTTTRYTDTVVGRTLGPVTPQLFCDGVQETGSAKPCTGVDQPRTVAVSITLRRDANQTFRLQATRRVTA